MQNFYFQAINISSCDVVSSESTANVTAVVTLIVLNVFYVVICKIKRSNYIETVLIYCFLSEVEVQV